MPAKSKKGYTLGRKSDIHELTMPSGDTALVRRPGVQGLIKMGLLDSLDSLTSLVQTEHFDRVAETKKAVKAMSENAEAIRSGLDLMDRVVIGCVIEPKIYPVPVYPPDHEKAGQEVPDDEREQSAAYVDWVDLDDKSFILQFVVGGSSDLAAFRKERDELMDDVPNVQDVSLPS